MIKKQIIYNNLLLLIMSAVVGYLQGQTSNYENPVLAESLPDPTIIRGEDGAFYLFATEDIRHVPIMKSMNLVDWDFIGTVFSDQSRPGFVPRGGIWAPDVSLVDGKYVLYYSMSTWGGEWTCGIGRAIADKPQGPYRDLGKLFISSEIGVQNSIDPFYIEDGDKKYLFWGSFRGIYAVELSEDGLYVKAGAVPQNVLGTAFEGTYIIKRDNFYYAFASIGSCCEGINSTYTLVVGRSRSLLGPYSNKSGNKMLDNNYEVVIRKNERFVGTGHNSEIVQDDDGKDWIFYHAVDVNKPSGRVLMMDQIYWDTDGWPRVENNTTPSLNHVNPVFYPPVKQDLKDFQKLRGKILSSEPEDAYRTHAYNAFDTNQNTNFKAKDKNGWVGLDLGGQFGIKKVRVYPRSDRRERLVGAVFQGADNSNFNNPTNLYTITDAPEAGSFTTYDISSVQKFQYVRCIAPSQNCNLAELEFYGDEGAQQLDYPQLTNLPTVYLETKGQFDFVSKDNYVVSNVLVADKSTVTRYDASVRGRGNSTWEFMEKKPIRIKFDKKQHFLGLPANAKSWTLIACAVDKTFLRNGLAFEISRSLNFEFTPSCVMVDVVLDGFYYGTFMASDQLQVGENRIDIDEMTASDIVLPNLSGGYHLEIDAYAAQEPVFFKTTRNIPITIKSPDSDIILPVQIDWIKDHINLLEQTLFSDAESALETYIDIESAVKYYLHSELTGNCDSYWCIHTNKKRSDDKLYFGPVWDYDQAFLTNNRVPLFQATLDQGHGVAQSWFRTIMQTNSAQHVLDSLWKEVKRSNLKQQLLDYIDDGALLLQQSQALNFQRWNSLNRKVWFEDALFPTYGEYIDFVKQFIDDRFNWFDERQPGERLTVLPASRNKNPLQYWQYTFDVPDSEWFLPTYDDSEWMTGKAPFGTEQNLQNTPWKTNQINIRTSFNLTEESLDKIDKTLFELFHDEDCQLYLNGNLALERSGYITQYQLFEFDKSLLKVGSNLLAIQCNQTGGGQLIDAGIYGTVKEFTAINNKNVYPKRYAWQVRDALLKISQIEKGSMVGVFGIDGKLLNQQQVNDGEMSIQLPYRGIYIIHINETMFKIVY